MPRFPDHPLVAARERAGLTQSELARRAGVSRATVAKIEGAVTRQLDDDTAQALEHVLRHSLDPSLQIEGLQIRIDRWFQNLRPRDHITPAAQSILHLTPAGLEERFDTFKQWRAAIAPSTEFFAALIGVHRRTVEDYERGVRVHGMSSTLAHGLLQLGISEEYLAVLRRLEHSTPRGR